ncbi:hypothetical protein [Agrobacterium rubi]
MLHIFQKKTQQTGKRDLRR